MIIKMRIAGKWRELTADFLLSDLLFLNRQEDMEELGIYNSNTLQQWNDPEYLRKICAAGKENTVK